MFAFCSLQHTLVGGWDSTAAFASPESLRGLLLSAAEGGITHQLQVSPA